jgi:hypothetical protein
MSLSTPMEAPSAFVHGVYDLTKQFTPYLDQHHLLLLLEFLEKKNRYALQDVLKAQLNVLKSTKMIDRRIDIQGLLNERNGVCVNDKECLGFPRAQCRVRVRGLVPGFLLVQVRVRVRVRLLVFLIMKFLVFPLQVVERRSWPHSKRRKSRSEKRWIP